MLFTSHNTIAYMSPIHYMKLNSRSKILSDLKVTKNIEQWKLINKTLFFLGGGGGKGLDSRSVSGSSCSARKLNLDNLTAFHHSKPDMSGIQVPTVNWIFWLSCLVGLFKFRIWTSSYYEIKLHLRIDVTTLPIL